MIYVTLIDNTKITYNTFNEIVDYDKIIKLNCYYNQLTLLPESIGNLINLQYLHCSYNRLSSLPDSLENLINLKELYCTHNQLTLIPNSIGNLINLKVLFCSNNQIKELPESIGNLINLKTLYCHNNQIKELPETIINLKKFGIFKKDELTLTPQQKRYFKWIESNKSYPFDEHVDMVLVKCAYFGV